MRLLIADDSSVSRHLLESIVKKWGYQVISTSDGDQAWNILQRPDAPRLAVLDWMMPGKTGPEVCSLVRQRGADSYVYILLLTSRTQKEDVVEGMMAGADDYILKPFDQQELNVRLRAGRRIIELQDELLSAQALLRHQATHDALTGVKNRGRMMELLRKSAADLSSVGILMLDLDRFKSINDTYGHSAGDAVLCETTRRLQEALSPDDHLGRYGGEEFLILTPLLDDELFSLAERLRLAISDLPFRVDSSTLEVTVSIGASSGPASATSIPSLLRSADEALYAAKNGGRNQVRFHAAAESCEA
jgi:two-component system, cell cycle response regulator